MLNRLFFQKYLTIVIVVFAIFNSISTAHAELIRYDFKAIGLSYWGGHAYTPYEIVLPGYAIIDDEHFLNDNGGTAGVVDFKWGDFKLDRLEDFNCICDNSLTTSRLTFRGDSRYDFVIPLSADTLSVVNKGDRVHWNYKIEITRIQLLSTPNTPIAEDDTVDAIETARSVNIDVLANDSDRDGSLVPGSVTVLTPPLYGDVSIIDSSTGIITYTRYITDTVNDSFTYTVKDNDGGFSNIATVTIAINPIGESSNLPPVASNDISEPIEPGEEVVIDLLANDNDSDGSLDLGSITINTVPTNGTILVDEVPTGFVKYIHDGSATTTDTFTYTVKDSQGAISNEATVSITIASNPVASCSKALDLDGVNDWINIPDLRLAGDFTIEGWFNLAPGIDYRDAIFGQEGSGPDIHFSAGRVRLYAYGIRVTAKTPLIADTWGHIAITRSGINLTVYVNGVKDATGRWNGPLSIKAIGRGNRGFAKGMIDEIRIWELARTETEISNSYDTSVDPNTAGLLGYWSFNNADQKITDVSSFENHGSLGINTAAGSDDPVHLDSTVLLNERCGNTSGTPTAPIANDDTVGPIQANSTITFNVTENDVDSDGDLNPTGVVIVSAPNDGIATVNPSGTITYISTDSAAVTDTLRYTVTDSEGLFSNEATVTITLVPIDEPPSPIAVDDYVGSVEAGGTLTFSVLDNDEFFNISINPSSVSIISTPIEGNVTVNGDGTITYINTSTAATLDTLSYTVEDVHGVISNIATVTITVIKSNEAPVTVGDLVGPVYLGGAIRFTVTDNDVDNDGNLNPSSVEVISGPYFGTATVDSSGIITYAQTDPSGPDFDQLTYTVADTEGAISRETTISIKVIQSTFSDESVTKLLAKNGTEKDGFGKSVSISGNTAVITAIGDSPHTGAAYVFVRNGIGGWIQQAKLIAVSDAEEDGFGTSASISGDTIVIGAFLDSDKGVNSGSAYIFVRDENGSWSQQAKLVADDGDSNDLFGASVSIFDNTVVIGAVWDNNETTNNSPFGSAYIFVRDEVGHWNQQTKLTPDDVSTQSSFGKSVSISGDAVIIGTLSNSAYVFIQDENGDWNQQNKLVADNGSENDRFGSSVSVSENTAVIGAPNSSEAYVFVRDVNSDWNQQTRLVTENGSVNDRFGSSVSISKDTMIISAAGDGEKGIGSGSAYVFVRDNFGNWNQQKKLVAYDGSAHDRVGRSNSSVSISGKTVVVGAVGDDDYGSDSGSAYIYDLTNIDTTASCGKGIEFDGINDWINIPDLRLAGDFTIEGWFKIAPGIDYRDAIFGQEGSGPDIHFSAGRVRLYAYGIRITAKTPLIADTWGHIAITRSGTTLTVYINGVKDATGRWKGILNIKAIGRGNRGFVKGMMDEIRIWNLARTEAEISSSFDTSVDPNIAGLLGYWNLNGVDQIITDSSSMANHGMLGANTSDGTDDPVRLNTAAPLTESCD